MYRARHLERHRLRRVVIGAAKVVASVVLFVVWVALCFAVGMGLLWVLMTKGPIG